MNFVIGERSAGKTYAFKERSFKRWKAYGSHWAYVRRSKEEIDIAKVSFWDDFISEQGYEVKTKGIKCMIRPTFVEEEYEDEKGKIRKTQPEPWELFGYFLSITEGQNYKGATFPGVDTLCLDEFIIENQRRHYIPDEVKLFLGVISSVFRKRKAKVICLSNSGAIANPYFDYYGVGSEDFKDKNFIKRNNGNVIFEYYSAQRTDEEIMDNDVAKISGENFIEYAFKNKFADASEEMTCKKPLGASPTLSFTFDGSNWFTLYSNSVANGRTRWIRYGKFAEIKYSLNPRVVIEEAPFRREFLIFLTNSIDSRSIWFESVDTRAKLLALVSKN